MGWKETCAVEERMRFVMAVKAREESFAATCRRFGVSRRIGYKWFDRYQADGVEGSGIARELRIIARRRCRLRRPSAALRCGVRTRPGGQ